MLPGGCCFLSPSGLPFFGYCWEGVIPLLAGILFIQGVASWIGLVVLVACLIGLAQPLAVSPWGLLRTIQEDRRSEDE